MEIDWFGHACFRLHGKECTVITDPYSKEIGLSFARPRGDIVTISHDHPGHHFAAGVKGEPKVIAGPGEYEIKNVFITGVPTAHDKKGGKDRGSNTVYVFDMDGLTICGSSIETISAASPALIVDTPPTGTSSTLTLPSASAWGCVGT